jgi:anthranilate phosphoribosyltransferase
VAADRAANFQEGLIQAEAAIDTGAATAKLEQLVEFTRKNG